jgi:hypothetical protein
MTIVITAAPDAPITIATLHTAAMNSITAGAARRNGTNQGSHHPCRSFATWLRV